MVGNQFFKRILSNKVNFFPVLLILVTIPLILFFNGQLIQDMGLKNILIKEAEDLKLEINDATANLQDPNLSDQDQQIYQSNIEVANQMIEQNQEIIDSLVQEDYPQAYGLMLAKRQNDQRVVAEHPEFYGDTYDQLMETIIRDQEFYSYLIDHQLKADEYQPVFGWTFAFSIWNEVLPWLLAIILIFVLTNQYSKHFYQNLDLYRLKPSKYFVQALKEMGLGLIFAISIWAISLLFAFLLGSIIFEMGSWNHPILTYDSSSEMVWLSLKSLLGSSFLLQLISLLSLVVTIYLVTFTFKNKFLSMVINLLLVVGTMGASYFLPFFETVAAWIPYNYLQATSIITGQFNHTIAGLETTLGLGLGLNLGYVLFLLLVILLLNGYREGKHQNG